MILAIDTATRWAGLALHDGTAVIAEHGWRCQNNHTREMTPAINQMLARAALAPEELHAIAVAIGPGSYTGLRVGLALAKGMALAHHLPLVGVNTLDIIAAAFGPAEAQLVAVIAAGRRRITAAGYTWQGEKARRGARKRYHQPGQWQLAWGPQNDTWDGLLAQLEGPALFAGEIPEEGVKRIYRASRWYDVVAPAFRVRRAAVLAEIGWQRHQAGETAAPAELTPIYMRDPAGQASTASN